MTALRSTDDIVADLRGCAEVDTQTGFDLNGRIQAEAADRLAELDAEVLKLRHEVSNVMRRETKMRESFATWTHRLTRRIQKLKANIADEERYIATLRAEIVALTVEDSGLKAAQMSGATELYVDQAARWIR